jgi:hypothetical protein
MSTLVQQRPRVLARAMPGATSRAQAPLAAGLVGIALGLAAVALLGPLATGLVSYRVSETLRDQTIGLDAVSLFVVAPLSVV